MVCMSGALVTNIRGLVLVALCLCLHLAGADNSTDRYVRVDHEVPKHQPRFLTFHTEENRGITMDLEFAVPFLTIPVKGGVDSLWGLMNGGIANINVGALVLAGAIAFAAAFILPFFSSLFFKHVLLIPDKRSDEPNDTWRILTLIDQALLENNIDSTSCMQRTMCWLVKKSRNKLNSGAAGSQDKIIDGLATSPWLNTLLDGSAMQTAIHTGLENSNCSAHYKNCKITQKSMQSFAKRFSNYIKYRK